MTLSPEGQQLRDRFFKVLLEASLPLQPGSAAGPGSGRLPLLAV